MVAMGEMRGLEGLRILRIYLGIFIIMIEYFGVFEN